MSDICFDKEENFHEILALLASGGSLYESRIAFCILHGIDDEILRIAEELDQAGIIMIFYVVTDENIDHYIRQSTERRRIIAVSIDAKLEGTL